MTRIALALVLVAVAVTPPALAQMEPVPSNDDSRIGVVHYAAGQDIRLTTAPGSDLTVLMPRGERVQQVTSGDTASWHIAVAGGQDALTVYALHPVAGTSVEVRTDQHAYELVLSAAASATGPYIVRIEAGSGPFAQGRPQLWSPPVVMQPGTYKLTGAKQLLPHAIRDDGRKIYIEWSAAQPIPAIFARDSLGREEMIDGAMRDGAFTLDHLYDELVFRIDKAEARARRIVAKAKR